MDCSPPGSSVHGILQARILEWVAIPFPGGSDGKESACNAEDQGLISGLGRSLGEGNCYPLQYSCLENPHGQRNLSVNKESETNKQLALTVTKFLPLSPEPVLLHLTSCCQGWSAGSLWVSVSRRCSRETAPRRRGKGLAPSCSAVCRFPVSLRLLSAVPQPDRLNPAEAVPSCSSS